MKKQSKKEPRFWKCAKSFFAAAIAKLVVELVKRLLDRE